MYIYLITNKINGKQYVGQTTNSLKHRFAQHCWYGENRHSAISKAIQKHGKENFAIDLIEECLSIDQMNHREIYWISFYKSISPNGYNLDIGGNGKGKHTQETINKIQAGRANFKHSDETKKRLSEINMGKKMSIECIEKQRKRMTGNQHAKGNNLTEARKQDIKKEVAERPPISKSGYKGVYWSKIEEKFGARFEYNGEFIWVGWFNESKNAAIAVDIIAKIKRPEFGYLNFPKFTIEENIKNLTEKPSKKVELLINSYIKSEVLNHGA